VTSLTTAPPGECRKTGKILASFVDPRQAFGPDKIIPPNVLANAKVRVFLRIRRLSMLPKQTLDGLLTRV